MRKVGLICILFAGCFYDFDSVRAKDAGSDATGGVGRGGVGGDVGGAGGSPGTGGVGGTGNGGLGGRGGTGAGVAGSAGGSAGTAGSGGSGNPGLAGRGGSGGNAGTTGVAGTIGTAGTGGIAGTAGTSGTTGAAGRGGTTGAAGTGGSGGTGGTIGSGLVLWYKFDEASGTTAADSSGNARNGTVTLAGTGTSTFSTTHQVGTHAIDLNGTANATSGAYVSLPASLNAMGATTAVTIACWVNVTTARNWAKVFDFNNTSTTGYMFLTTQEQANSRVRFAITQTNNAGEQMITSAASLATGWHHIAVVLDVGTTYTGTIYIDGAAAGTNTAMTLRPSNLGNTVNNFIGKSSFTADPYFDGLVDDFRIYNRPLAAGEIAALYADSGGAGAGGQGGGGTGAAGAGGAAGVGGTAGGDLTVRLRGDAPATVQAINVLYQITNNGTTAIPMSDLTIRYWYTYDTTPVVAQTASCNYAQLGCQNITFSGTFVAVSPARTNADYYFQIGFSAAASALAPGATTEIQLRFNKNDFSNYTQTNDYSFNGATAYATTTNVTVYRSGVLVYGVEPP